MKYCIFILIMLLSVGCDGSDERSVISFSNDKAELLSYVDLPVEPDSVLWCYSSIGYDGRFAAPGPVDHYTQAVLFYNDSTLKELISVVDTSSKFYTAIGFDSPMFRDWFPAQIKALFYRNGTGYTSFSKPISYSASASSPMHFLIGEMNTVYFYMQTM